MQLDRYTRTSLLVLLVAGAVACGPPSGGGDATPDSGDVDSGGGGGDTGPAPDATASDTGGGGDAGGGALHNCTTFLDRSMPAQAREVHFHSPSYSPRCMTIAAGQSVLFMGPMAEHPLVPGVAPSRAGDPPGTTPNPIPMSNSGENVTVMFPTAGLYPFYCSVHEGSTMMYGVIQVR